MTTEAPERLTKQVCPDGFIDCRAHPASSLRNVEYARVDPPAAPTEDEMRALAAERVANFARQFCEELQEDAEGIPSLQLASLNEALDTWEAYPGARASFDDNQPVLAALASLVEDQHATDHQRRVARLALTAIQSNGGALTEPERNRIRRAIAESDIAGCALQNSDIDALVDLFEAWLERRVAAAPTAPPAPDEAEKAVARKIINDGPGGAIYHYDEHVERIAVALAQARKEAAQQTWEKAVGISKCVTLPPSLREAREQIVDALESASKVER